MESGQIAKEIRLSIRRGETGRAISLLDSDESVRDMMTPFGSWLHVAASFGNLEILRHLVAAGADVNRRGGTSDGTALNEAASKGHLEIVQYLFSRGATLDVDEPHYNPLFSAIYGGHEAVVNFLIGQGIDTRIKYTGSSMKGMDAQAFALERGQRKIAQILSQLR